MGEKVLAWSEQVNIPTYAIGRPNKNPMFLEKRVYQGSSGVVYPHPMIDWVSDTKQDQTYTAVFLENRYLKIMLLPEIGGRVQMALDKTNGYHFVYYNQVIKPALVGLAGPWISGGIEFNWPQHHRPSTFDPVDWRIDENPDGSKTVWCAEIEHMFRTKGMHGFSLYPDRAYLKIHVKLSNHTSEPQSFLWWANPAVHVNDDYQSVFPPDVHAVMDHGKRAVSDFPIATGVYYKVDYAPGTDISRYKNIPVPTSYMAYHSDFDFMGCYDHGPQAGMLHIANHHLVPGKKQWTWGNSDFGQAWDRQLTDEDGPYIELMCGAFTDNQPDFSWLMPGEEKSFSQVFMPYKLIGPAKNANTEAAVNLEIEQNQARIGVYLTSPRTVRVQLLYQDAVIFEKMVDLNPESALLENMPLVEACKAQDLILRVSANDQEIISYQPLPETQPSIPDPATPARPPREIASNEELFLNGLHLEQYRHATYAPEPYYEEALRRDPDDSRCNNAMGLLLYRRGKFAEAESYFRRAVKRLTSRNPNPYDGEPFYNLGLSLKMQGRNVEAFDAFYKATWNAAWQDAAFFELARLAAKQGRLAEALDLSKTTLRHNFVFHKARHLKIALLRRLGNRQEAWQESDQALTLDPMEYGALWERWLLQGDNGFFNVLHTGSQVFIELALDYAQAGFYREACELFEQAPLLDPMLKYFQGWICLQSGDHQHARQAFEITQGMPPDYCFPNQLEAVLALQAAMQINPQDSWAPYYLGNFWYAHRRYDEAIECWERSRQLNDQFPTVHRNLGLAYFNKMHDPQWALCNYEQAFALDPQDARVFFELDQLQKRTNSSPGERFQRLKKHIELVEQRDDLMVEYITLLNILGQYDEALHLLDTYRFHPWEGGEGKVPSQYVWGLIQQARQWIGAGRVNEALEYLERACCYPDNLGEGKLYGALENHIDYFKGLANEAQGNAEAARVHFQKATGGLREPTSAIYYNDQPPDMIFYQGLAYQKIDKPDQAEQIFQRLLEFGRQHLNDDVLMDYFAVSLPNFLVFDDDLSLRNRIHCHYMMALGYLGLGDHLQACSHFDQVLAMDRNHFGANIHRKYVTQ